MTTIAAKVAPNNKVKIAWDSQVTSGGDRKFGATKVVKINDQFALGVAGRVRYMNILQRTSVDQIHKYDIAQPDFDAFSWILDTLVPAWMKALRREEENNPYVSDDFYELPYGHGLLALAGGIYTVGADLAVVPVGEFGAIGSGSPYANTAMHLGKSPKQAVEVATELDMYTGGTVKEMTV